MHQMMIAGTRETIRELSEGMFMENPIKILRKTQGLRQIDLAERVDLSIRTISGLEIGDSVGMHMRTAEKIAHYFNVDAIKLLADYMVWRANAFKCKGEQVKSANYSAAKNAKLREVS